MFAQTVLVSLMCSVVLVAAQDMSFRPIARVKTNENYQSFIQPLIERDMNSVNRNGHQNTAVDEQTAQILQIRAQVLPKLSTQIERLSSCRTRPILTTAMNQRPNTLEQKAVDNCWIDLEKILMEINDLMSPQTQKRVKKQFDPQNSPILSKHHQCPHCSNFQPSYHTSSQNPARIVPRPQDQLTPTPAQTQYPMVCDEHGCYLIQSPRSTGPDYQFPIRNTNNQQCPCSRRSQFTPTHGNNQYHSSSRPQSPFVQQGHSSNQYYPTLTPPSYLPEQNINQRLPSIQSPISATHANNQYFSSIQQPFASAQPMNQRYPSSSQQQHLSPNQIHSKYYSSVPQSQFSQVQNNRQYSNVHQQPKISSMPQIPLVRGNGQEFQQIHNRPSPSSGSQPTITLCDGVDCTTYYPMASFKQNCQCSAPKTTPRNNPFYSYLQTENNYRYGSDYY